MGFSGFSVQILNAVPELVPTIPQIPKMDLTQMINQHDGQTHTQTDASNLYIRIEEELFL